MPPEQTTDHKTTQQPPKPTPKYTRTKSLAITVFILLLIVGGLWYLFIAPGIEDPTSTMDISITADGFEPGTVLIEPGTTVNWTNDGHEPHWIASNPHPDNDDLPGLNSEGPIGIGSSYSYTFEESGEYGYHDHLNPETSGTVIVE